MDRKNGETEAAMSNRLMLELPEGTVFGGDFALEKKRIQVLLRQQRKSREDLWKAGKWREYIFIHINRHRWQALKYVSGKIAANDGTSLAELFREVWIDSEHIWKYKRLVAELAAAIKLNHRRALFTESDWETFENLPDPVTIYRGAKSCVKGGVKLDQWGGRKVDQRRVDGLHRCSTNTESLLEPVSRRSTFSPP